MSKCDVCGVELPHNDNKLSGGYVLACYGCINIIYHRYYGDSVSLESYQHWADQYGGYLFHPNSHTGMGAKQLKADLANGYCPQCYQLH